MIDFARILRARIRSVSYRRWWLVCAVFLVVCSAAWIERRDHTVMLLDHGVETVVAERKAFSRTVKASGQLDSWKSTRLISKCYWDTNIIKLVPEGTLVKKGDIICELDATRPREYAKTRRIRLIRIRSELATAELQRQIVEIGNRRRQNRTTRRLADAEIALKEYKYGLEPLKRDQLSLQSRLAADRLEQAKIARDDVERMLRKGVSTRMELDTYELDVVTAEQRWRELHGESELHEHWLADRNLFELEGRLDAALSEEQATRLRNELNLTQAEFARLSDERRFAHYTRYLGYALDSIEACTIRAPHAGRVVYANDWNRRSYGRTEIELGAEVDYRQAIVDLPDYSRFVVQAWVHEAVINDLVPGQPVTVRIPALDNVKLTGSLSEVARFPTVRNYFQPGVREFQVEIEFDDGQEPLQKLAPRMDANAEILVDFDLDVLQVPLGCIIHPDRQAHVIVSDGMSLQARPVETGRTDETNVEILSGLEPGDLVVVSPSAELQQRVFDAAGDAGESADS